MNLNTLSLIAPKLCDQRKKIWTVQTTTDFRSNIDVSNRTIISNRSYCRAASHVVTKVSSETDRVCKGLCVTSNILI